MKRRNFFQAAGLSLASPLLLDTCKADSPMGKKPAFRLDIGRPLPDPFCIRHEGRYYLTGTHSTGYNRTSDSLFDLYRSADLHTWEPVGRILKFPEYEGCREANYWAPEILVHDNHFYLYYTSDSFGDPYRRHVRVAVGDRIEGPYVDSGRKLVQQPSIDGHPVFVSFGEGWLFYTGNEGNEYEAQMIVDRFVSPTELAGEPRKVFPEETVTWEEGGFTAGHGDGFYLFTSMGNWRDGTYHVLVARADRLPGPFVRLTKDGGPLKLLETKGEQSGPGHNSVFDTEDGTLYICYHAWDKGRTGRYPWAAPIYWEQGLPVVRQL
ncbi:MAG: family 43 glycosylhydrolase [Candidatus Glassbacteria bacterium]